MKILSIGGFFHDLNFTYLDINKAKSLISAEEERFSRIKGHSILNFQVTTSKFVIIFESLADNLEKSKADFC